MSGIALIVFFIVSSVALAVLIPLYFYLTGGLLFIATFLAAALMTNPPGDEIRTGWIVWFVIGWVSAILKYVIRAVERSNARREYEELDAKAKASVVRLKSQFIDALEPARHPYEGYLKRLIERGELEAHDSDSLEKLLAYSLIAIFAIFRPESSRFPKSFGVLIFNLVEEIYPGAINKFAVPDYETFKERASKMEDRTVQLPLIFNLMDDHSKQGLVAAYLELFQEGCALDASLDQYAIMEGYRSCFREYLMTISVELLAAQIPVPPKLDTDLDSYFTLLGVSPDCSREEIKAAYLQKVKEWHPDQMQTLAPELRETAHNQMTLINEAYQALLEMA